MVDPKKKELARLVLVGHRTNVAIIALSQVVVGGVGHGHGRGERGEREDFEHGLFWLNTFC